MKVEIKGKTVGKLQSCRMDFQRKWKRTLTIDDTIKLLIEEAEK